MNKLETETSADEAVRFLSSRVGEHARRDSVPLSDIELKQLSFSEEVATAEEIAAARAFDDVNDTDEFEAKITELLRTAFHHDVQHGMRASWENHLAALRNHDVYILVMVDQAGIPRPKPAVQLKVPLAISPATLIRRSPNILAGLIALCGLVYFFVLRFGWHRSGASILGNFARNLLPNEKLRGIFLFTWLGSMLWLWVRARDFRDN